MESLPEEYHIPDYRADPDRELNRQTCIAVTGLLRHRIQEFKDRYHMPDGMILVAADEILLRRRFNKNIYVTVDKFVDVLKKDTAHLEVKQYGGKTWWVRALPQEPGHQRKHHHARREAQRPPATHHQPPDGYVSGEAAVATSASSSSRLP